MKALARFAVTGLLAATLALGASAQSQVPPPPIHAPSFALDDGSILRLSIVQYPPPSGDGYAFGIWKQRSDGSPDTRFTGTGFVAMPIWGYYEGAFSIVVQHDGRIVVMGFAADPTILHDTGCYPAFCGTFLAFVRLDDRGNLDYTFGTAGKVVLDYPADDAVAQMKLRDDGMIDVFADGALIARLKADGSLDTSWVTPQAAAPAGLYPYVQAQGRWNGSGTSNAGSTLLMSHQGEVIFAAVARPTGTGSTPQWVFGNLVRTGPAVYKGTFYSSTGNFRALPFDSSTLAVNEFGTATLRFPDAGSAVIEWSDGSGVVERFAKDKFGPPLGCAWGGISPLGNTLNLTDFWFDPKHPGWGVFISDDLFYQYAGAGDLKVTLFGYDGNRAPFTVEGVVPYLGYGSYTGFLSDGNTEVEIGFYGGNEIDFDFSTRPAGSSQHGTGGESRLNRMVYEGTGTACR